METKKKTKIYVQMLGGFSITVGDEKLDLTVFLDISLFWMRITV